MAKLQKGDFFHGAVLSLLINKKYCPALIDGGEKRQIYRLTTDGCEKDRILFLKYRSEPTSSKKGNFLSWSFDISKDETMLREYLNKEEPVLLGLVCGGRNQFSDSEYAMVKQNDVQEILDSGKKSFTIKRRKNAHSFHISIGKDKVLDIKARELLD